MCPRRLPREDRRGRSPVSLGLRPRWRGARGAEQQQCGSSCNPTPPPPSTPASISPPHPGGRKHWWTVPCVLLAVTFLPDIPQPCLTDSHSSRSAQPNAVTLLPAVSFPRLALSHQQPGAPPLVLLNPSTEEPFHRGAWVLDTPAHTWAAAVTQPRPWRTLHRQESTRLPVRPQRPVQVRVGGKAAAPMLLGLSLPVWTQINMTFMCHLVSGTHGARCPAGPACTTSVPRAQV